METIFRYTVSNPAGNSVDSIARVPLWIAGPAENPNKAITIKQVEINGAITSSVATPILVDALDSISIKVDLDEAMIETEDDPLISFFATEGRFEAERVLGTTATNELNIKDTSVTEVEIYVVARDGRGSQAVFGGIVVKKQL